MTDNPYAAPAEPSLGERVTYKFDPTQRTIRDAEGRAIAGSWVEDGPERSVPWQGSMAELLALGKHAVDDAAAAASDESGYSVEVQVTASGAGMAEATVTTQNYRWEADPTEEEEGGGEGGEGGEGGSDAEEDFANGAKITVTCTYVEEPLVNHPTIGVPVDAFTKEACVLYANGASMADPLGPGTIFDALKANPCKLVEKMTSGITSYMAPRFQVTLEKKTSSPPSGATGSPRRSIGGFTPPGGAELMGTGYTWDSETKVASITYISSGPGGFDKDIYPS